MLFIGYATVALLTFITLAIWRMQKIHAALTAKDVPVSFDTVWRAFTSSDVLGNIDGVDGFTYWVLLIMGPLTWPVFIPVIVLIFVCRYLLKAICATVIKMGNKIQSM